MPDYNLISLILTAVLPTITFVYYFGRLSQRVTNLEINSERRFQRIEDDIKSLREDIREIRQLFFTSVHNKSQDKS